MEVSPALRQLPAVSEGLDLLGSQDSRMATQHEPFPSEFSFVVDDVDGDQDQESEPETEDTQSDMADDGTNDSTSDHSSGSNKEQLDARIRQIKGEAESRKNEFAKLLEEHAQVIKQLKQMEDEPPSGAMAGPTKA